MTITELRDRLKCLWLTGGQHRTVDASFTTKLCVLCDKQIVKSGVLRQKGREFEKARDRQPDRRPVR